MSEARVWNLVFVGVGGQGVLLASDLVALAAAHAGLEVKTTEVHGLAQRGGSVESHVRFGGQVWAPMVTPGEADVLVALEKLEALRFAHYFHPARGHLLANDTEVIPATLMEDPHAYPHDAFDTLRARGPRLTVVPASQIARDLGEARAANVVMLGALSRLLPLAEEAWLAALETRLPERLRARNLQAFHAGRLAMEEVR